MAEVILSGQVLFVNCKLLINYPRITAQLTDLLSKCGFSFNCCIFYNDCNSYLVMYIDDQSVIDQKNPQIVLDALENKPELITACTTAISFKNIAEIYSVCTDPDHRRKGHMAEIFDAMKIQLNVDRFWLGVDLNNPGWTGVLDFYISQGFGDPVLTRNSGGSLKVLPKTVLGLTWERNSAKKNIIKKADYLRNQYYRAVNQCTTRLYISKTVTDFLKSYLDKSVEYAGVLISDGYLVGSDGFSYANIVYPTQTECKGDSETFAVNVPPGKITFHTHPEICYKSVGNKGCYIGWPSGQDMAALVFNYPTTIKHYVITIEGIYSIQLTLDMQLFLNEYSQYKNFFYELIRSSYTDVEHFREIDNMSEGWMQKNVHDFMVFSNNYTIKELLRDKRVSITTPKNDFGIFTTTFHDWERIDIDEGVFDCLSALDCGIPIEKGDSIGINNETTVVRPQDPQTGFPKWSC